MKVEILGIVDGSFKDQKTGELVSGIRIHYHEPIPVGRKGQGIMCSNAFLSSAKLESNPNLQVGHVYRFYYNRYGKFNNWEELDV